MFRVEELFFPATAAQFQTLYNWNRMNTQRPKPFSIRLPLFGLYVAQIAMGATQCFPLNVAVYWVFSWLVATLASMWVVFDASHRGKPLVSIVQLIVLFSWPIAVPVYLITSRGIRGLGWTVLNVTGLIVANMLGYYATILVYWGPDALSGR